ncbi:MAG: DUF5658 family protein [Planctomycetota bacterium]|nr:DUF5658 family protein [Planctomycetota bacterium]
MHSQIATLDGHTAALTQRAQLGLQTASVTKGLWFGSRECRVVTLLVAVALISIGDLAMTLTYATSVGMMEVNPLARLVMSFDSPWLVVAWKLLTAGFGITVIAMLRSRGIAEIAAWISFAAMLVLLVHWINFNTHIVSYTDELTSLYGSDAYCWVQMTATTTP